MRVYRTMILVLSGLVLFRCDTSDKDNPVASEGAQSTESQRVIVWASFDKDEWDDDLDMDVYMPHVEGWGVIGASPLPVFEYYQFNDDTYTDCFYESPGAVFFGEDREIICEGEVTALTVEVKTSLGKVSGSIQRPNALTSVSTTPASQLSLYQSLTVSWTGGANADFYEISAEYEWYDNDDNYCWMDLDTLINGEITGNFVTFPGSLFSHDGEIEINGIVPVNGPLPKAGAAANMFGNGTGFLYYINDTYDDEDIDIEVGNGLYKPSAMLQKRPPGSRWERRMKFMRKMGLLD